MRSTHLHVIGQPGTGKSRAIESWFMQDVAAGHGVGVLDPHGELFDHLLAHVAQLAQEHPDIAERVIIVNPLDRTWTVGFNPLDKIEGISPERQAAFLSDVVVKITRLESTGRTFRLLNFTFLALSELGLTLMDLPRFLVEEEWREQLLLQVSLTEILRYFHSEFPKARGAVHEWITPVLNRIGPLLFDPDLRLMYSIPSTIRFREILDRGMILLVNLSKGQLGEANSALLGAFIVAHIQKAALARVNGSLRRPFFLYLDEFQNYTTDNIKDILSESRKYALSLILAHQFLDQLAPDLLSAVLNTTGTLACFRVGYRDAAFLSHEIFSPGTLMQTEPDLAFLRFGPVSVPWPTQHQVPLQERELVSLLTGLRHREFWVKPRGPHMPFKQRTFDMPAPEQTSARWEAQQEMIHMAGMRHGRLKCEIREKQKDGHPAIRYDEPTYYEEIPPPALPPGE